VLNYRARLPIAGDRWREERRISVNSIPEQLEETAVVPESNSDEETPTPPPGDELVVEDLLVEDVSIDGMCGVY
jgi:mycofactocin precursor